MPSPRRKAKEFIGGPTASEMHYLLHGRLVMLPDLPRFYRDGAIVEAEARAIWEEYRDEIHAGTGLVPWAAVAYDGHPGPWDRYAHLRGKA